MEGIRSKLSIDKTAMSVVRFLQYELCYIKAALDRLKAEQFVYSFARSFQESYLNSLLLLNQASGDQRSQEECS